MSEAAKVFARYGFRKTSIDEIAHRAGVAKGTVYLTAASKEELFFKVLDREVRSWLGSLAKLIDPEIPADQLLGYLSAAALGHLEEHPLVKGLFFGELSDGLPALADRLSELRKLGQANVAEILKLGIRQGIFRADLDVDSVARVLQDLQLATYLLRDQGPDEPEQYRTAAFDLVLNGLRTKRSPGLSAPSDLGSVQAVG